MKSKNYRHHKYLTQMLLCTYDSIQATGPVLGPKIKTLINLLMYLNVLWSTIHAKSMQGKKVQEILILSHFGSFPHNTTT